MNERRTSPTSGWSGLQVVQYESCDTHYRHQQALLLHLQLLLLRLVDLQIQLEWFT